MARCLLKRPQSLYTEHLQVSRANATASKAADISIAATPLQSPVFTDTPCTNGPRDQISRISAFITA